MRDDEEKCKAAFHAFLSSNCNLKDIVWADGDEPPDYYLSLANTRYAVEVTQVRELVSIGNKTLADLNILVTVRRFIKEIEREAITLRILTGAYSVSFKPLENFGNLQQQIKGEIKEYLQATQNMPFAAEKTIIGKGHSRWEIKKCHNDRTYLSCTTFNAKFRGEAIRELLTLLDEILNTKSRKLTTISKPWILLIADRYPWLDHSDWHESAIGLGLIKNFHTVFLVSGDKGNNVLHSQNSDWLGA